jgi:hypothetical protein
MPLIMRRDVQEYLRASAKLFGLAYQENALTQAEREAIVSYAQELTERFSLSNQPTNHAVLPDEHPRKADARVGVLKLR